MYNLDKKEIDQYLDILNRVAIVSKTDLNGKITFVNDMFCEISGYSRDELMEKQHKIVRHPDMPSATFKNLWETISQDKVWQGSIKNLAKDGGSYHVNTTILPAHNENGDVEKYIAIRFLTTVEEEEKRKFKQKVVQSFTEQRKESNDLKLQIKKLEIELKKYENIEIIQEKLELEKQRSSQSISQVTYLEDKLSTMSQKLEQTILDTSKKVTELHAQYTKFKNISIRQAKQIESQQETLEMNTKTLKEQLQEIKDLTADNKLLNDRLKRAKKR